MQMNGDDVSDINIITEGSLEKVADNRNKDMNEVLVQMGMARNCEKEEHIVSIYGKGCVREIQDLKTNCNERRTNTNEWQFNNGGDAVRIQIPGDEAGTARTNTKGKRTRTNEGDITGVLLTQEGVDVSEALKAITTALCHMDMRTRSLEAATYITIETVPENEFVVEALKGTKEFNEMIAKANREKVTKVMKKGI